MKTSHIATTTAAVMSTALLVWISISSEPATQSPVNSISEIHSYHCLAGCPIGMPSTNDLLFRHIYTMSTNDETKFADWVAYVVDAESIIPGNQTSRNWKADPWLDEDETLEPADYTGANAALKTDRGHQAPLASFRNTDYWAETNYLSNITPQKSDLNQGPWVKLENHERDLAESGLTVYVLTGPLYETAQPILPGADEEHTVPSAYWKIVTQVDLSGDEVSRAYIFAQETPRSANFADFEVLLSEVSSRSNLVFFPRLLSPS